MRDWVCVLGCVCFPPSPAGDGRPAAGLAAGVRCGVRGRLVRLHPPGRRGRPGLGRPPRAPMRWVLLVRPQWILWSWSLSAQGDADGGKNTFVGMKAHNGVFGSCQNVVLAGPWTHGGRGGFNVH